MSVRTRSLLLTCLLIIPFIGSVQADTWVEWTWKVVDDGTDAEGRFGEVGLYSSLALTDAGDRRIAYYAQKEGTTLVNDLRFASSHFNSSSWTTETVDSVGDVGKYCALAIDFADNPHISYLDSTNGALKYATHDGTAWQIETVDTAGGLFASIAIFGFNQPAIAYRAAPGAVLKFAWHDGTAWQFEIVESDVRVFGIDMTVDRDGNPHLTYHDINNRDLKYATRDSNGVWTRTTLDADGDLGRDSSISLDSQGYPHIGYRDETNRAVKYARFDGTAWTTETVDSVGNVGEHVGLVVDRNDQVHMVYTFGVASSMRYASLTHGVWLASHITLRNRPQKPPEIQPHGDFLSLTATRNERQTLRLQMSYIFGEDTPVLNYSTRRLSDPVENIWPGLEADVVFHKEHSFLSWDILSPAGDVNGDGFNDMLVSNNRRGTMNILYGGGDLPASVDLDVAGVALTDAPANPLHSEKYSIASAGDMNGDGYDDIAVGVFWVNGIGSKSGITYVVFGGPALPPTISLGNADLIIRGVSHTRFGWDHTGWRVESAGDLNGDGFDDLIINATPNRFSNPETVPIAYIVLGGAALSAAMTTDDADVKLFQDQRFTFSENPEVRATGDVNGDGFSDLLIRTPGGPGEVYLQYGRSDLPGEIRTPATDVVINGTGPFSSSFGDRIVAPGDMNNDGINDFLVRNRSVPAAYIFYGHPGLIGAMEDNDADVILPTAPFGRWFDLGTGDINGDGIDDMANSFGGELLYGSLEPLGALDIGDTEIRADRSVLTFRADDLNGDGISDMLFATNNTKSDEVYLIYGPPKPHFEHRYNLFERTDDTYSETNVVSNHPSLTMPSAIASLRSGVPTEPERLFVISSTYKKYYWFDTEHLDAYTINPTTGEAVIGYGRLLNLWADGEERVPNHLLGWNPTGGKKHGRGHGEKNDDHDHDRDDDDHDDDRDRHGHDHHNGNRLDLEDELWAFSGTDYFVFDPATQKFGPAQPLANIGADGLVFDTVAKFDPGNGKEILVATAGNKLFVYSPTAFPAGQRFMIGDFTQDGSSFVAESAYSIDENLDGTDSLYLFDLDGNATWKWIPSVGKLVREPNLGVLGVLAVNRFFFLCGCSGCQAWPAAIYRGLWAGFDARYFPQAGSLILVTLFLRSREASKRWPDSGTLQSQPYQVPQSGHNGAAYQRILLRAMPARVPA